MGLLWLKGKEIHENKVEDSNMEVKTMIWSKMLVLRADQVLNLASGRLCYVQSGRYAVYYDHNNVEFTTIFRGSVA